MHAAMLIYSGDIKEHKHGVGMLLNKEMSYMADYAISGKILLVKLHCKPFNLTLIEVYAPTSTRTVEDYMNSMMTLRLHISIVRVKT